jgi:hypothetical protein
MFINRLFLYILYWFTRFKYLTIKSIKPLGPANEPTGFTVTWYEVDPADNSVSVMYIKDDAATYTYLLTSSFHLPSGHKVIVTSELDKHIEDCE